MSSFGALDGTAAAAAATKSNTMDPSAGVKKSKFGSFIFGKNITPFVPQSQSQNVQNQNGFNSYGGGLLIPECPTKKVAFDDPKEAKAAKDPFNFRDFKEFVPQTPENRQLTPQTATPETDGTVTSAGKGNVKDKWSLLHLLDSGDFSDFTLFVGRENASFHVHRAIVSAHSEFFKQMCYKENSPSSVKQAFLHNQAPETAEALLRFLYSGKSSVGDLCTAARLLDAAVDLGIPLLKNQILRDVPKIMGMAGGYFSEEKKKGLVKFLDNMYTRGGLTDKIEDNTALELLASELGQFKGREDFQKLLLKHSRLGYELVLCIAEQEKGIGNMQKRPLVLH